jgi:preprotein translocase subunit SecG
VNLARRADQRNPLVYKVPTLADHFGPDISRGILRCAATEADDGSRQAAFGRLRDRFRARGTSSHWSAADLGTWINIAQIIISIALIGILLLQTKGAGWTGAFGADQSSVFRTRRGIQKTLFQMTIVLAVVFIITSLFSSYLASRF